MSDLGSSDLARFEFTHDPDRDVRVVADSRGTSVWRYLDLAKFVSLLKDRALYLARADSFEDKWEGSFGALDAAERERAAPKRPKKLDAATYSYWVLPRLLPANTFLNCWHVNNGESEAMWSLYTTRTYGVALQSTITRLSRALRL